MESNNRITIKTILQSDDFVKIDVFECDGTDKDCVILKRIVETHERLSAEHYQNDSLEEYNVVEVLKELQDNTSYIKGLTHLSTETLEDEIDSCAIETDYVVVLQA